MDETNLSKSLYRAVMKALGSNEGQQHAVDHIVDDIEDPNMEPNTPSDHIPAAKEGVLHKDVSVSEMHQQKQAAAEAAVGMRPGQQKPAMKKMNYASMMGMSEENKDQECVRGIDKLRKFMEKSSMKKAQKGVHPSVKDTRNRYRDDETKRGISEMGRQARKASLYSKGHELGQAVGPENIKRAKEIAREKLFESKQMPKPNLPKSEEMDKAIPAPAAPPVPASAKRILSRPTAPKHHERLVNDEDVYVRQGIAMNPNLDPKHHERLVNDKKDKYVRQGIAMNPNLDPKHHERLANDKYASVRQGIAMNPNLDPKHHERLVNDKKR